MSTLFKNVNMMHFRDITLPLQFIYRSGEKLYGEGRGHKAEEY